MKKVPRRIPKNSGGGGQGKIEKNQTEADFFFGWLPLVTDLMNDKGVCRTAPATPGLLYMFIGRGHFKRVELAQSEYTINGAISSRHSKYQ